MRKLSTDKNRARTILAAEIFKVVRTRLEKSGFTLEGDGKAFHISSGGSRFARILVIPFQGGVHLGVTIPGLPDMKTGIAAFVKQFGLHDTESPRRIAALIVSFLRKAQIKLVMTA